MLKQLLQRFRKPHQQVAPIEPPPAPPGWRLLPPSGDHASYEVRRPLCDRTSTFGPGIEFCGVNATEFHGFPAGTLSIGGCRVGMTSTDPRDRFTLTYRFDYRAAGWQRPGATLPACDFHRLPWGAESGEWRVGSENEDSDSSPLRRVGSGEQGVAREDEFVFSPHSPLPTPHSKED